jgi:hypothetical protein
MPFVVRHTVLLAIVSIAFLTTAGVFLFARPEYHRANESAMIDFSKLNRYSAGTVRRAFAAHGIKLYAGDIPTPGMATFSSEPRFSADAVQVMVGPPKGTGSWGPKLEPFDERFRNVLITYGGARPAASRARAGGGRRLALDNLGARDRSSAG